MQAKVGSADVVFKAHGKQKSGDLPPFGPMRALLRDGADTDNRRSSPALPRVREGPHPGQRGGEIPKLGGVLHARGMRIHQSARFRSQIALWMLTGLESVRQEDRKNYDIAVSYGGTERFLRYLCPACREGQAGFEVLVEQPASANPTFHRPAGARRELSTTPRPRPGSQLNSLWPD